MKRCQIHVAIVAISLLGAVSCNKINKGILIGKRPSFGFNRGGYYPYLNQGYSMFYYTNMPGILPSIPSIPPIPSITETIPSIPPIPSITETIPSIPPIPSIESGPIAIPCIPPIQSQSPLISSVPLIESMPSIPTLSPAPIESPIPDSTIGIYNSRGDSNASTNMENNSIASSTNQIPYQ